MFNSVRCLLEVWSWSNISNLLFKAQTQCKAQALRTENNTNNIPRKKSFEVLSYAFYLSFFKRCSWQQYIYAILCASNQINNVKYDCVKILSYDSMCEHRYFNFFSLSFFYSSFCISLFLYYLRSYFVFAFFLCFPLVDLWYPLTLAPCGAVSYATGLDASSADRNWEVMMCGHFLMIVHSVVETSLRNV